MPSSEIRSTILDRAVQILVEQDKELPYRDLHSQISAAFPNLSRIEVADLVGELVTHREDRVWRPRPGYFAVRPANWTPAARTPRSSRTGASREEKSWTRNPLPNRVENLQRIGFQPVGEWQVRDGRLSAQYDKEVDIDHSLLAFVVNGSVSAIAIKSDQPSNRMTQAIHRTLTAQKQVKIYAFTHETASESLGTELIERMQPPWNDLGRL